MSTASVTCATLVGGSDPRQHRFAKRTLGLPGEDPMDNDAPLSQMALRPGCEQDATFFALP
jgi:hypothetical protein